MHTKIQRFDFGSLRDFTQPLEFVPLLAVEEELPPAPPPPVFSEDEISTARIEAHQAGFQEGFSAGQIQEKSRVDALQEQTQNSIVNMLEHLKALDARYAATIAQQSAMLSELVLVIAGKVAGDALNANGGAVIAELVNRCLPSVLAKPRLMIELHPDTLATAELALREVVTAQHYEGEIIFRNNPTLGLHDARIDWENGHAERSTAELWEEISALVRHVPMQVTLAEPEQTTPLTGENNG